MDKLTMLDHIWYYWHQLRMKTSSKYRKDWVEFEGLIREAGKKGLLK